MEEGYLPELGEAIGDGDLGLTKRLLAENPHMLHVETPFGSWLDMAATEGHFEIVRHLVSLGLDVNRINDHGEFPICCAADSGNADIVAFLLEQGASLDVRGRDECANPMFGAILGKSPDIARLLLAHGLDASIDYGKGKTVASFALLYDAPEVADVIAEHLAEGDHKKKAYILAEAQKDADRQSTPSPVRILPSLDDLEE